MTTPFAPFANAILTIPVPTGAGVTDSYGIETIPTEDLIVTAMLKQKRQPISSPFNGGNEEEIYIEGRCVDPASIPATVAPETICDATVDGQAWRFRYLPSISNPFVPDNSLGQKLRGYLLKTTLGGNAA